MATLIREPPFVCIFALGSFDTYIYTKGGDFMGISIKSDARRSYIQRIVVPLPNKWKKYEQKFANIK